MSRNCSAPRDCWGLRGCWPASWALCVQGGHVFTARAIANSLGVDPMLVDVCLRGSGCGVGALCVPFWKSISGPVFPE